jgi:hypothetical protein
LFLFGTNNKEGRNCQEDWKSSVKIEMIKNIRIGNHGRLEIRKEDLK